MRESEIQNQIRVALSLEGTFFRANVGQGWTGTAKQLPLGNIGIKVEPGDVFLKNARRFSTGLPPGFSDLFGFVPVKITLEMVGKTLPIFSGVEVKTQTGRIKPEQQHFISFLLSKGCRAGFARSVEDSQRIARGG